MILKLLCSINFLDIRGVTQSSRDCVIKRDGKKGRAQVVLYMSKDVYLVVVGFILSFPVHSNFQRRSDADR